MVATNIIKKSFFKFLLFLSVLGPGIVTAIADNDAGGIATYSVAASLFGYAALFLTIPSTLLLAVSQDIGAKIAIVNRKGLGDLIRERYGIRWSVIVFILLFITNQGVVIQNISGLNAALSLIDRRLEIALPFIIAAIWFFLMKGSYKSIQKAFILLTLFYFSYVLSAVQSKPDWKLSIINLFYPSQIQINIFYIFTMVAVLGTTVTAWGQFFISSYIRDKGIDPQKLRLERLEIYIGAIITNFFSFMIMIAVATTIFSKGIPIESAKDAALAIRPFASDLAFLLFSYGLFVASILGAAIVPLATAYAFSEFFGFERSLDKSFSESKIFYIFLIMQLLLGYFATLFPHSSLFQLTLYADFLNGAMLPVIFFFLFKFSNDASIMGKHKNNLFDNTILIGAIVIISLAVVISSIGKIFIR